jgi:hypothetical protein
MTELTNNFSIEPLVLEIQNVINKGLKKILKDYIDKFNLLDMTHKQIMMLPSVVNELNKNYEKLYKEKEVHVISDSDESDSYSELSLSEFEKSENIFNTDITRKIVKDEVSEMKEKIEEIEKKFNSFLPILTCISMKINSLSHDIKTLKESPSHTTDNNENVMETFQNKMIQKPFIVTSCENENIKFDIKEEQVDEDSVDEQEEEQLEEQVEEQVEVEEVEEEQVEEEEEEEEEEVEDDVETEASTETITKDDEIEQGIEVQGEEEEEELVEIEIDDITYCTNNEDNGFIYELSEDGEVGNKVGYLKEGEPFFYADEK